MNIYQIFAYITGALIVSISLMTFVVPSRKANLYMKASGDLISVINLIFIYLATNNVLIFAGIGTTIVGFTRDIVFSFKDKCKALKHIAWPIGYSILFLLTLFITYKSPLSLLPPIGSVISTIALYITNQKLFKLGSLISAIFYIVYYAILLPSSDVLTMFSLLSYVACLIGCTVGLVILFKKDKKHIKNS